VIQGLSPFNIRIDLSSFPTGILVFGDPRCTFSAHQLGSGVPTNTDRLSKGETNWQGHYRMEGYQVQAEHPTFSFGSE
jgi:hypothetical protein